MDFFLVLVTAGISVGAVYALVALGLNLTFWTTRTLNFGQGALMMFCAMITAYLASMSIGIGFAILAGVAVVAILGLVVERIAVRPSLGRGGTMGWVVATLGFGTFIQGVATEWFGSQSVAFPEVLFSSSDFVSVAGVFVSMQYVLIIVVSVAVIVLFELFTRYTHYGQAMKAVALDAELATVQGVPVERIVLGSFMISSALAAITGILVAQIGGNVDPAFGFDLVLLGFVAAVLGGMGNSWGALIGGIAVGILSKLAGGYVNAAAEHALAFVILIIVLVFKPHGLFGSPEVSKV
jgi:branched-chain amino acid transport system permease protein